MFSASATPAASCGVERADMEAGPTNTTTCPGCAARDRRATHQLGLAHLLRRCREMPGRATRGAVVVPRRVKGLLAEALAARDGRDAGGGTPAAARADDLDARMHRLLRPVKTNPANERPARHLWANRPHLFTFLRYRGRGRGAIGPDVRPANRRAAGPRLDALPVTAPLRARRSATVAPPRLTR